MNKLRTIQLAFQKALQQDQDKSILDYIAQPAGMRAEDRLQVYRNDYFFRLFDSLKDDFEMTCQFMGEIKFKEQVENYLTVCPSTTYTLREFGLAFPGFLQTANAELAVVELARFECEMIYALYAADAPALTLKELTLVAPNNWLNLKFLLHPSVRHFSCQYNTLDLWSALNDHDTLLSENLDALALTLVWRYQQQAYFRSLSVAEKALFESIQSGFIFSDLCEKMLEYFDEDQAAQWVAGVLQTWVNEGLFASF